MPSAFTHALVGAAAVQLVEEPGVHQSVEHLEVDVVGDPDGPGQPLLLEAQVLVGGEIVLVPAVHLQKADAARLRADLADTSQQVGPKLGAAALRDAGRSGLCGDHRRAGVAAGGADDRRPAGAVGGVAGNFQVVDEVFPVVDDGLCAAFSKAGCAVEGRTISGLVILRFPVEPH